LPVLPDAKLNAARRVHLLLRNSITLPPKRFRRVRPTLFPHWQVFNVGGRTSEAV
jgi:hypothetical protein